MIRVLVYVLIVFLVAAGAAWLADRPGEIVLNWQGYEIRTTLLIAAIGVVVLMAALAIVWALLRAVFRAPSSLRSRLGRRRRDRGYRALNAGIIAVGAGDARAARQAAEDSRALLGPEPLVLLLSAQAAQLSGDGDAARTAFQALAGKPETRLLGLHGLFVEAERHDEHEAARHFAEEAAGATPRVAWAGAAMFDYAARDGDWKTAIEALDANLAAGLVGEAEMPRMRAALMTARAMELEAGDPDRARLLAVDALTLDPGLAPAAAVAARLYSRRGDLRRASRVLEGAWKVEPNPEIADAYATVRPGDSVLDRLKRMRRLSDTRANHPDGAMAIARAAIDAGEWDAAREALDGLAKAPTERVCLLMAEIEDRENNDQGRVRAWLTRALSAPRDPAWVADGQVLERWLPVSPVTGRVAGVAWAVPPEKPRQPMALEASPYAPAYAPYDTPVGSVDPQDMPRLEHHAAADDMEPVAPEPPPREPQPAPAPPVIEAAPVVAAPPPPQPPMTAPSVASASGPAPAASAVEAAAPVKPAPKAVAGPEATAGTAPATVLPPAAVPPAAPSKPVPAAPAPPAAAPSPSRPAPAAAPAAASAAVPSERDEEPAVPHAPDDPGPLPPEPEEEPGRRRFRLF